MYKIVPPIQMGSYDIAYLDTANYANGSLAVVTYTTDGENACTVSVNIVNESDKLPKDEFYVKEYSENYEPVSQLIERGIISIIDDKVAVSGFVVCRCGKINFDNLQKVESESI